MSYAEVFVLNENGMVIGFEHCKSKSFSDLQPALERIWSTQSPAVSTDVVWTDNVNSDEALLRNCYHQYRPSADLKVGQVHMSVNVHYHFSYISGYAYTCCQNQQHCNIIKLGTSTRAQTLSIRQRQCQS